MVDTQTLKNGIFYPFICAAYCVMVLLANIISAKLIPIGSLFNLPAGVLFAPVTFFLCALTTEIYGASQARTMVFMALGLLLLSIGVIQITISLPNSDPNNQMALNAFLGLSPLILFSSLAAYAISQLIEVSIYSYVKKLTKDRLLWLRNSSAAFISQALDTALVNTLYLAWGLDVPFEEVSQVVVFSYLYKLAMGMIGTPMLYFLTSYLKNKKRAFTH